MSGDELRAFRDGRGLSQEGLASLLNRRMERAYDKSKISRWETGGERIPKAVSTFLRTMAMTEPVGLPLRTGPAIVTAFGNQKGGVGKTAAAVNVGYLLAKSGKKVLIVDCDPQGSATIHFGMSPYQLDKEEKTLAHILNKDRPTVDVVVPVCGGLCDLIASAISLAEVEAAMLSDATASLALREKIQEVAAHYDHIILDCPPNLGLMTASALNASDLVLIPSQAEMLSIMGIPMLLNSIGKARRRVNPKLAVLGILPTQVHGRRNQDKAMLQQLEQAASSNNLHLFSVVRDSKDYPESVTEGRPALEMNPNAPGLEAYSEVVQALIAAADARNVDTKETA